MLSRAARSTGSNPRGFRLFKRLKLFSIASTHEMDRPPEKRKPYDLDHPPQPEEEPEAATLEIHLGPLVDRLLLAEGIRRAINHPCQQANCSRHPIWLAARNSLRPPSKLPPFRGGVRTETPIKWA